MQMKQDTWLAVSLIGTFMFASVAMLGLAIAGAILGSVVACACGLLSAGVSYLAQQSATEGSEPSLAMWLQLVACGLFVGGVAALFL